ncbi:MAG: hypothetical protein FWH05_01585 [Oscillospiraceae bacterium]|nr:hypothetical protein [Oscillospiraceae bacterium]
MITELNKLIKAESKKFLIGLFGLNIAVFAALALVVVQYMMGLEFIVFHVILAYLLFLPFITICGLVICIMRTIKPNAEKGIKLFCNKTDSPQETFRRLEQTWEHGTAFVQNQANGTLTEQLPIRIDRDYLIGIMGFWLNVKIIPFENAVWVHAGKPDKETGIADRLYIYSVKDSIYSRKKYKIKPMANVDLTEGILDYIVDNCPNIAVGKYKEAENLWNNKNIDGLREFAVGNRSRIFEKHKSQQRKDKAVIKSFWHGFIQFCSLLPALAIIALAVFLGSGNVNDSTTVFEILQAYEAWSKTVFTACIVAILMIVLVNVFIIVKMTATKKFTRFTLIAAVISIGLVFFIYRLTTPLFDTNAFREDIYAIENNTLTTGLYWIDLNSLRDDLGGIIPFNDFGERVVYRQDMSGRPDAQWWLSSLYFTESHNPDYLRAIAESNEYQVWERTPDRRYFIVTHTPNFRLVVDIMPTADVDK